MNNFTPKTTPKNANSEHIREQRYTLRGPVAYTSGCGERGQATWLNISRTGAAILLGRYLRPGRPINLELAVAGGGVAVAIPAEIAWCVPIAGTHHFRTGLKILRNDPEIALHFASLGYAAQAQNKINAETVIEAVWPPHNVTTTTLPNADVITLTHAV